MMKIFKVWFWWTSQLDDLIPPSRIFKQSNSRATRVFVLFLRVCNGLKRVDLGSSVANEFWATRRTHLIHCVNFIFGIIALNTKLCFRKRKIFSLQSHIQSKFLKFTYSIYTSRSMFQFTCVNFILNSEAQRYEDQLLIFQIFTYLWSKFLMWYFQFLKCFISCIILYLYVLLLLFNTL